MYNNLKQVDRFGNHREDNCDVVAHLCYRQGGLDSEVWLRCQMTQNKRGRSGWRWRLCGHVRGGREAWMWRRRRESGVGLGRVNTMSSRMLRNED
jgi:hypothetical protein